VPSLTAREDPVIGRLLHVDVSDSASTATLGLALVGASSASIATGKGGTLLVAPLLWVPVAIGTGGATLSGVIADDPALVGLHGFLQVLEVDAGASKGISFTPGLDLTIGFP
jgi:hypothetical protein